MELRRIEHDLTVCKLASEDGLSSVKDFYFVGKTDEEISLVCITENAPKITVAREDGWRAFRIQGVLDFSLIGILSDIAGCLAENGIGIFAISTFNTDYILVKKENFDRALNALSDKGYDIK